MMPASAASRIRRTERAALMRRMVLLSVPSFIGLAGLFILLATLRQRPGNGSGWRGSRPRSADGTEAALTRANAPAKSRSERHPAVTVRCGVSRGPTAVVVHG